MAADLLLDLLLLASILGLGALATYCVLGQWATLRVASLAFPVGSGILTWVIFLASWAGLHIDLGVVAAVLVAAYAVCLGFILARRRNLARRPAPSEISGATAGERPRRVPFWLIAATGIALVAANLLIAVSSSYSQWDSIAIWSLQGYGIAHAGSIFGAGEGAHGLAYPMNIPIQIAAFTLAGGDWMPGSKAIFSLYFLSLLLGFFFFARGHGVAREKAGLAALALATVPAVFTESTSGYANAPMAVCLALGAMALFDGVLAPSRGELLLGGLLLGFAGWTRVEGILYSTVVVFACFAVVAAVNRARLGWTWALAPLVLVLIPWFAFYRQVGSGGSQAMGSLAAALEAIRSGEFRFGALRVVLLHTIGALRDIGAWGWVWVLAPVMGILALRPAPRSERIGFAAFSAMAAGTALVTIGIFYVGSFRVGDLRGWLDRSFDRAYMVTPMLLLIGTAMLLVPRWRQDPFEESHGDGPEPGRVRSA